MPINPYLMQAVTGSMTDPTQENFWLSQLQGLANEGDTGETAAIDARKVALRNEMMGKETALAEYNAPVKGWQKYLNPAMAAVLGIAAIHDLSSGNRSVRGTANQKLSRALQVMEEGQEKRKAKRKEKLAAALGNLSDQSKQADIDYQMAMDLSQSKRQGRQNQITAANYALGSIQEGKRTAAAKGPKPLSREEIEFSAAGSAYDRFINAGRKSGKSVSELNREFAEASPRQYNMLVSAGQLTPTIDPNQQANQLAMEGMAWATKALGPGATPEDLDKYTAWYIRRAVMGLNQGSQGTGGYPAGEEMPYGTMPMIDFDAMLGGPGATLPISVGEELEQARTPWQPPDWMQNVRAPGYGKF